MSSRNHVQSGLLVRLGVAASALAGLLGSTAVLATPTQTGTFNGQTWTASSDIVGQTSTATQAPPTPPGKVGDPIYLASNPKYSGVVTLIMNEGAAGNFICSGSLLNDRVTIVTAGHCVSHGAGKPSPIVSATAYFNTHAVDTVNYADPTSVAIPISQIHVNPKYTGEVIDDNDLSILRLATAAPKFATSYSMYTGGDLTGVDYNVAGYGGRSDQGGSVGTDLGVGRLRQGNNRYDFAFGDKAFGGYFDGGSATGFGTAETTYSYVSDFDNGLAANDASCLLAGAFGAGGPQFCNTGLGASEVSTAPGDSGGPQFVNGQIASVTSYGLSFGSAFGDIDNKLNDTFGEFNGFVPLEHSAAFIAGVPEPASWGMMLVGFGFVGVMARRRGVAAAA